MQDELEHDGLMPGMSRCPECGGTLGELRVERCPHCGAVLTPDVWDVYQPPRGPVFKTIAILIIALVVVGSIAMFALTVSSQCSGSGPTTSSPTSSPSGRT